MRKQIAIKTSAKKSIENGLHTKNKKETNRQVHNMQ
jgi:hypothetical protein